MTFSSAIRTDSSFAESDYLSITSISSFPSLFLLYDEIFNGFKFSNSLFPETKLLIPRLIFEFLDGELKAAPVSSPPGVLISFLLNAGEV